MSQYCRQPGCFIAAPHEHRPDLLEAFKETSGMKYAEKLKAVAAILKKHFTNLSVAQTIDIADETLTALGQNKDDAA